MRQANGMRRIAELMKRLGIMAVTDGLCGAAWKLCKPPGFLAYLGHLSIRIQSREM
jgi:hypothetical protein